ncbi:ABC transporter ATP-binding protein [Sulfitobacter sp. D35]|uniref:ABC transporter ATP-binding protein n=1 Tax=Sulfitobacter sp. D35 TaxID=3083252 RepID=UPI00296F5486|nr:ABC transporter ATP-binding protein [Sulfitobacter sp. D35]MDW4499992.1 ABC transporter ATP-binding protein [Sulfitobacter sp. D35]
MTKPPSLLNVTSVDKAYGGLRVVQDMSLNLASGEVLGVIGPNGAGKSTLFNLIAGAVPVDSGTITLGDADLTRASAQQRLRHGLARSFQIPRPFPRMTVLENVMTGAQDQAGEAPWAALLRPSTVARQERANAERARELLDFVNLSHLEDQPAAVLSGGQRKLLELARVLMTGPRVILLDEPAAGVNPALLDTIMDRIEAINAQGIAVLLIEHNMEMIARLCPRVIVMAMGSELAQGSPAEVSRRADVIEAYLEGMPA